jgi:hypoxanthine-guanine phosphoribosyltransferase
MAVLLDKPERRRVALEPDYFGFRTASKDIWVGYGLAASNGTGRNGRQLSTVTGSRKSGASAAGKKKIKGRKK